MDSDHLNFIVIDLDEEEGGALQWEDMQTILRAAETPNRLRIIVLDSVQAGAR